MLRPAPTGLEEAAPDGAALECQDLGAALVGEGTGLVGGGETFDFDLAHGLAPFDIQPNGGRRSINARAKASSAPPSPGAASSRARAPPGGPAARSGGAPASPSPGSPAPPSWRTSCRCTAAA